MGFKGAVMTMRVPFPGLDHKVKVPPTLVSRSRMLNSPKPSFLPRVETSKPDAQKAIVDTDWVPDELRGNKPTTYDHPYSIGTAPEYVPAPPEPYKTFDQKNRY